MKTLNESIVFKVNENYSESLLQFGNIRVVVVDDFYENPDLIRDLILSIPATTYTPQRHEFPGKQISIRYDLSSICSIYKRLIGKYFPNTISSDRIDKVISKHDFLVNVLQSKDRVILPHEDNPRGYASGIYFNTNDECSWGTSFYERNTCVGIAEMKYNRMVLYEQFVCHNAYMSEDSFVGDLYRISQQLFIQ
tara:strand:- start:259 stop:840 length:582 start_codon:yes stop_codon:yes gene_type:complete